MRAVKFIILAAALMATGCASSPPGSVTGGRRLVVQVQVAGEIKSDCYYYFAIDTNGDPNDGPEAVVGPPNGWGAGTITHYVQFHDGLFSLWKVLGPAPRLNDQNIGQPHNFALPEPNTLWFVIDLDQLELPAPPSGASQTIEVNFITTDDGSTPSPGQPLPRRWDALGDGSSNTFLSLPLTPGRTVSNTSEGGLEPEGDVRNEQMSTVDKPDLDIIDWSIEVQQQ